MDRVVSRQYGRQSAAIFDARSKTISARLQRFVRRLVYASLGLSVMMLLGSLALWTGLSIPDVYAVSPQGRVVFLPMIK